MKRSSRNEKTPSTSASSLGSSRTSKPDDKPNRVSRRSKMKHRILSEDSFGYGQETSTDSVHNLVREIIETRIPSLSLQFSNLLKEVADDSMSWRGWIIIGQVKPIALLTSETCLKKDKGTKKTSAGMVEEEVLQKLMETLSSGKNDDLASVSVTAVKNVKLKIRPYTLSDLEQYETKIRQGSTTSLFKEDITGLRDGNTPDVYADITTRYDLPDIYKEEGSQASSTKLRIFKATANIAKQPTCSLNDKARERLFLMFSPSDDNVLDIMNNSQIKNKMLRHEIGRYLKPKKASKILAGEDLKNTPLYRRRRLPSLVPVEDLGILKNYPTLTPEIIFDQFFKENEIRRDGYTILVKEQPLLVENITLCLIPKETISMAPEKKKQGFVPRYTYKDREGEEVTELPRVSKVRLRKYQPAAAQAIKSESIPEEADTSDPNLLKSIIKGKLCEDSPLKVDLDIHLNKLTKHLRDKVKPELVEENLEETVPTPTESEGEQPEEEETPPPPIVIKSKWDKFELDRTYVREDKERIVKQYNLIEEELAKESLAAAKEALAVAVPMAPRAEHVEETLAFKLVEEDEKQETATDDQSAAPEISEQPIVEEEEYEPSIKERPTVDDIMDEVRKNKTRLKKDVVIPVVKPELPKYLSSGKKRFYMTDLQQYWAEFHTDVNTFYHNQVQQSGHNCSKPVINDERMVGAVVIPKEEEEKKSCDDEENEIRTVESQKVIKTETARPQAPTITPGQVDEIVHELASPKFTYSQDKTKFSGLAPATYYKNSKKEIVALSYCQKFLRNYYNKYEKRRKLFVCVENELGVQKLVPTFIKSSGLSYKELDTWQTISKFVANNVSFIPLENPLYLPHMLRSPGLVIEKGAGHTFEISTLLASLLIGQGYDAYVVSGYANVLLTGIESSRNYLRYDCPYLVSEAATDPFQTFCTKSHVMKTIERSRKPQKISSNYKPTVAPYLDSSYLRQIKLDKEREKEEEALRAAEEEEESACKRYLSYYEADELEGRRLHSWILILPGKRNIEKEFYLEPSSGFAYETDDWHYYGVESVWNHLNYWINKTYTPFSKEEPVEEEKKPEKEENEEQEVETKEVKEKLGFDFANCDLWLPLLVNGPQMFKEDKGKKNKAEAKAKISRLQKSLDMPSSWCSRICITTNQVERRLNEPCKTSLYKRAVCHEYQVGLNEDGLVARVTKFSDLPRTDPEFEVQSFEKRRDMMYRRRRDIVSDKLTEYFAFGREECLQSHEFIDGADAMYCDHNLFFYWDFRDDGLMSIHMTDLYLKLNYAGRKDNMNSILVLYGSSIEEGRKPKRKGAGGNESGKTPRKEITTIVQQFDPSPDILPWNDLAKVTYRLLKGEIIVDFQYESSRVTVTTKLVRKSHDDPEVGETIADIAKKKRNRDDDEDCLSELDMENFDKTLNIDDDSEFSSEDDALMTSSKSKSTTATQSDRKIRKGKKGSLPSLKSSKKSLRDKMDIDSKKAKKTDGKGSSDESIKSTKSTKSSVSEGSVGVSDLECSSGDEKQVESSFYPMKLVADKDKSLWACSRKTKRFLGRKLLNSLFQNGAANKQSLDENEPKESSEHRQYEKISDFGHLTRDSSPESSGEEQEYLKELRKRQIKAISETNELYKAIERDEANPNIEAIMGSAKLQKLQLCKLEHLINHAKEVENDKTTIQNLKDKFNEQLHPHSILFPDEKFKKEAPSVIDNGNETVSLLDDEPNEECQVIADKQMPREKIRTPRKKITLSFIEKKVVRQSRKSSLIKGLDNKMQDEKASKTNQERKESLIDPLIVGIYTGTDRCLDDPLSMRRKRPFSRSDAKLKSIFSAVKDDMTEDDILRDDHSETQSVGFKKEGDGTLSDEEAANEKDVDSIEGDVYNSDDNYSLQSRNASSSECLSTENDHENEEGASKESFSCHSENEDIIEYQTEAPKHDPYDFEGFHFQAGKMYARKLYQLKEVCDNTAIDSDHQSSYEGDEDYAAEFLQGEIDKFLENTVDRITQDVREARNLIGGLKKGSDTNVDQTGVYYCNLSDRYFNYVDSYFKKINKKREMQSDKAFLMEMLKQKAKEPDKIIKHIREYVLCKKNGIDMELDENLMNLIPHVRPVEVKKKDRLGYEILTDDDEEEEDSKSVEYLAEKNKAETQRESIEPVIITTAELVEKLGNSPKATYFTDAVNNLKKFKDMETVNQLVELPLHECFSDVNIRSHLQKSMVNDGYFIDAKIDGTVREKEDCKTDLGFVIDPEHILLSKDLDYAPSSPSETEDNEQELKMKHMEILTNCGQETIKEADFFEPLYTNEDKQMDPFKPEKFRMFTPLDPNMLDSESDGSINTRIKVKRRKAFKPKEEISIEEMISNVSHVSTMSALSAVSGIQQRLDIDRTFGLEPIKQNANGTCRVAVKNMSVNDEVSQVDKATSLENFLWMEDDIVTYIRNVEAFIHNLLLARKKERSSFKRNILDMSRKGIRRSNFKVLQQKLKEFDRLADVVSFDWDLLVPYLHLLLPQDSVKKFIHQTADYIMRILIVDFVERELFKLKGLYNTYEKARQNVIEKKNMFLTQLETTSFADKEEQERAVISYNEALRRIADQAHILRFVILRRAKQSTKKFMNLISDIKKDDRINQAYSEARERVVMTDLSKRWPEHYEFIHNFSSLPVASEQNDFSSSYISPVDDIVIRKVLKQARKKPAKYILSEKTYERYLELMERDREYFDGLRKKDLGVKKKRSIHSIFLGEKVELNVDGKNSEFIDKLEIVNDLEWADFFFATESDEEIIQSAHKRPESTSDVLFTAKTSFGICSKTLVEELLTIQKVESAARATKETRKKTVSTPSTSINFEEEQLKKDSQYFEKYGTPEARKFIEKKLPEYFEYI